MARRSGPHDGAEEAKPAFCQSVSNSSSVYRLVGSEPSGFPSCREPISLRVGDISGVEDVEVEALERRKRSLTQRHRDG